MEPVRKDHENSSNTVTNRKHKQKPDRREEITYAFLTVYDANQRLIGKFKAATHNTVSQVLSKFKADRVECYRGDKGVAEVLDPTYELCVGEKYAVIMKCVASFTEYEGLCTNVTDSSIKKIGKKAIFNDTQCYWTCCKSIKMEPEGHRLGKTISEYNQDTIIDRINRSLLYIREKLCLFICPCHLPDDMLHQKND